MSRKRTRLEDQLSDIQYIDCNTPDNITISTTAVIHTITDVQKNEENDTYQPKNKSPRNSSIETHSYFNPLISEVDNKRQSLNLEHNSKIPIPKSLTEVNMDKKVIPLTTPTPQSPNYRQLVESSATTPELSPDVSPQTEVTYQQLNEDSKNYEDLISPTLKKPNSPKYENVLTTISITYKSPIKTVKSPRNETSVYEEVLVVNAEKAIIPTSTASLPVQQAAIPVDETITGTLKIPEQEQRPKSLSALEDNVPINFSHTIKANSNPNTIYNSENSSKESLSSSQKKLISSSDKTSSKSSELNLSDVQTAILHDLTSNMYQCIDNIESPTDLSLSEIVNTSTENIHSSQSSVSFPMSPSQLSPNVSLTHIGSSEILTQTALTPSSTNDSLKIKNASECSLIDETSDLKSSTDIELTSTYENLITNQTADLIQFSPTENYSISDKGKNIESNNTDEDIYQQVKYYRRSIHEINSLLDIDGSDKNGIKPNVDLPDSYNNKHVNSDVDGCVGNSTEYVPDADGPNSESSDKIETTDPSATFIDSDIYDASKNTDSKIKLKSSESLNNIENIQSQSVELDSLESDNVHIYENVHENSTTFNDYENIKFSHDSLGNEKPVQKSNVKSLTDVFEFKCPKKIKPESGESRPKKNFHEKDSLPPCLRARNLKQAIKTRSLDEDEFMREFNTTILRRKSFDDTCSFNSAPKKLNSPKTLPEQTNKIDLHLIHSSDNLLFNTDQKLNRERIEKYKEERRKFLHDKYRSESFKEDKDVLLSKFKVYKNKDEVKEDAPCKSERRRNHAIENKVDSTNNTSITKDDRISNASESFRLRAAKFETNPNQNSIVIDKRSTKNVEVKLNQKIENADELPSSMIRKKRSDEDFLKNERRRHTYDTRERERDVDGGEWGRKSVLETKTKYVFFAHYAAIFILH